MCMEISMLVLRYLYTFVFISGSDSAYHELPMMKTVCCMHIFTSRTFFPVVYNLNFHLVLLVKAWRGSKGWSTVAGIVYLKGNAI